MLSVALGLLAGISVLALYKGMVTARIRTVIDSEVGHLQVHQPEFKGNLHPAFILPPGSNVLEVIRAYPEVRVAVPRSITQAMLSTTTGSAGVQVNGIVDSLENQASKLGQKIKEGEGFHRGKKNEIVIGKKLADKMKLKVGSKLVLTFTNAEDELVSSAFRVAALYKSGNAPLEEWNVYVQKTTLNELLMTGNGIHEISVILQNDKDLETVHQALRESFPTLSVESWKEISPETDLMVKTVDDYSYIIMLIILIALAFGILNTMLMSVLERTREIGMMMALGTAKHLIFLMILMETIFLTLAGTPVGFSVAYFITAYFNRNGLDLSGMGEEMMASFGYDTTVYPSFPWEKLTMIMVMMISTAIISSLLPAIKALKMRPAETLKK
jgi:ABC-type lipoprotein release transport system permease subunit